MIDWLASDVVAPLIVGIVTSGAFLFLLSRIRPRIGVSQWLCRKPDHNTKSGVSFRYVVKIRNRTRSPVVDFHLRLTMIVRSEIDNQLLFSRVKLPWFQDAGGERDLMVLGAYDRKDPETRFLYRFIFTFDQTLEDCFAKHPGAFLRLQIVARHAFSGFSSVIEHTYRQHDITSREFKLGDTLDVTDAQLTPTTNSENNETIHEKDGFG